MTRFEFPFTIFSLLDQYKSGDIKPADVINEVYNRIEEDGRSDIWISLRSRRLALSIVAQLPSQVTDELPLYGIPFSVKDNIDVFGFSTTAACPSYSYDPSSSAHVVQ